MNAESLKKSILQWAIEGKLVPQINGEPEVMQLGEAPKEIPFDIPKKWKWTTLSAVVDFENGDRGSNYPAKSKLIVEDTGHPFVSAVNLQNNKISSSNLLYLTEGQYSKLRSGHIKSGDFLYCIRGSIGKFGIAERDGGAIASSLVILRRKPALQEGYLRAVLNSSFIQSQIKNSMNGTAQPNLGAKVFSNFLIPIPPYEEQVRIAKRLSEISPLIDAYGQEQSALAKLEEELPSKLRASLLQEAIQGKLVPQLDEEPAVKQIGVPPEDVPFAIPEKWKWARLGEVVGYGSASQVSPKDISGDTWVLDLEDIEKETGRLLQKKKNIRVSSNKSVFKKGDVLYGKLRPYLNKVLIANEDGVCTTEIVPISMESAKCPLDREYFQLYLMSPIFVNYANQCSYGVKMPRLGTKDAKAALIPIPPLKEQQRIVRKLKSIFDEFYILK